MWLHGNTIMKPMHSIAPSSIQLNSEYAEVTPTTMPKIINDSGPPEPYATVTLQHGAQSDDSCVKCSSSPMSSEYNAPIREPLNICDVLPPPPDHPYTSFKTPTNMTIRMNPVPMSPQMNHRRISPASQRWNTMGSPTMPNYSPNWPTTANSQSNVVLMSNSDHDYYAENEYESGSVLYEQCCRNDQNQHRQPTQQSSNYFYNGGEPTEEYYRNINMEYLSEQEFEPSTPPPPCPDSYKSSIKRTESLRDPHVNNFNQSQQSIRTQNEQSPIRGRRSSRNHNSDSCRSAQSSDENDSDNNIKNRYTKRARNRSKSSDRKFYNNNSHHP